MKYCLRQGNNFYRSLYNDDRFQGVGKGGVKRCSWMHFSGVTECPRDSACVEFTYALIELTVEMNAT